MIIQILTCFPFFFASIYSQKTISISEYANMVGNMNVEMQRIQTLNKNGANFCYNTELTEAFLEQCRSDETCNHVLEVGCAFGIKSAQIVQTGVHLVANDIDARHIEIAKNAFSKLAKQNSNFANATFHVGNIAKAKLENLGNKKFDAILAESVLHFMRPEEIRMALHQFNEMLSEQGKLYLTIFSPFTGGFIEAFLKNKEAKLEWPGFFEDPAIISPILINSAKPYHVFDDETLARELNLAGFKIINMKYIEKQYSEEKFKVDGRDWLIAIAERSVSN